MKCAIVSKFDQRIAEELYQAAEDLGADPAEIRALPLTEFYDAIERLGAAPHLLAIAGSWGDGTPWSEDDDAVTFAMLRDWNAETRRLGQAKAVH